MDMNNDRGMVYDPDQDPNEKRDVRKKYRSLQKQIEEKNSDLNETTAEDLARQIRNADLLFDKVKGPQEATLDSTFLLMASNIGAQKARAMKSGGGAFDVDDFLTKLVSFMGGRRIAEDDIPSNQSDAEYDLDDDSPLEWESIGRKAMAKSRRVPMMDFMLGPLSVEQKKRAVVKRAKLEKNKEDQRKPQEIKEDDISRSDNETSKNVVVLEKLLTDMEDSVNLFRFVINPHDFAQSVENLFHLSFLIRDAKVALETNENGEPEIFICEAPTDADRQTGELKKRQIVMEFDMATWKRAIDVFKITEPMIPTRNQAPTRIGNKWYG